MAIERMLAYNFFERLKNARTILNNAEVSENKLQHHLRIQKLQSQISHVLRKYLKDKIYLNILNI